MENGIMRPEFAVDLQRVWQHPFVGPAKQPVTDVAFNVTLADAFHDAGQAPVQSIEYPSFLILFILLTGMIGVFGRRMERCMVVQDRKRVLGEKFSRFG